MSDGKVPQCIGAAEDQEDLDEFEVTLDALFAASPGFASRVTLALCLSNASDAVETLSLGFAIPKFDGSFGDMRLPAAAVFVGMLAGGCAAGALAEGLGHQRLLVKMLYLEALSALATTAATGPWQLALRRFSSGIAIGAAVPPIFALAEELIHPRQRRHRSLSLIASSFISGSVLVSLLAWPLSVGWTWQAFYATTGVVPLFNAWLVSRWVPESPTFLQHQGRRAELLAELQRVLPTGPTGPHRPSLCFRVVQEANDGVIRAIEERSMSGRLQLLRPMDVVLRLAAICFSIAFAWYGLSTWLLQLFQEVGLKHRYITAIAYALSGVPGCVLAILLRCMEPPKLLAFWLLLTALSCLSISLIKRPSGDDSGPRPFFAAFCVCLFNSVATAVFNVLTTVWGAPFSASLRPFALGTLSVCMRLGSIVAQFVDGALVHGHISEMALVPAVLLGMSAVACWGIILPK